MPEGIEDRLDLALVIGASCELVESIGSPCSRISGFLKIRRLSGAATWPGDNPLALRC